MGLPTLTLSACLLAMVASQGIVYNSPICINFGISTAAKEMVTKYKTMVTNLNKDTTLSAQKTRATNFLNTNWKSLPTIFDKDTLASNIKFTKEKLESRWRIVTNLKGLLAKIKPKIADAKFTEIKNLLWKMDKESDHSVMFYYDNWKTDMLKSITNAAKKTEISKIVTNYETANPISQDDKWSWMAGMGFNKCGLS